MTSRTSQTIEITMPDGVAEAYLSRPDDGSHPGVLFYVDAIGLRPRIEEMADRIASWGYVVLAPHVFYRDGRAADLAPSTDLTVAGNREAFFEGAMKRVRAFTADLARTDLDAYVATLREHGAGGDLGVTGYCMGGRLSLLAACTRPEDFAATGAFHAAGLVTDQPDSVHRQVANARAEVLAGHADHDTSNPPEAVAALDEALAAAGLVFTTAVYPDAPHGFTMSDTAVYDEAATERHFAELEALFARRLG